MRDEQHPADAGHRKPGQAAESVPPTPVEPTTRQAAQVLRLLRSAPGGMTTIELHDHSVVHPPARIMELRQLGWSIITQRDEPHGVGRYVLLGTGGRS